MTVVASFVAWLLGLLADEGEKATVQVTEDAITGKLQPPPEVATEAEADPAVEQRGQDALDAWDKEHP